MSIALVANVGREDDQALMLTPRQTTSLLSRLCIDMGFCLPLKEQQRLLESPPTSVDAFTAAVFRAEGLDPDSVDRRLYRQLRRQVDGAFRKAEDARAFDRSVHHSE